MGWEVLRDRRKQHTTGNPSAVEVGGPCPGLEGCESRGSRRQYRHEGLRAEALGPECHQQRKVVQREVRTT